MLSQIQPKALAACYSNLICREAAHARGGLKRPLDKSSDSALEARLKASLRNSNRKLARAADPRELDLHGNRDSELGQTLHQQRRLAFAKRPHTDAQTVDTHSARSWAHPRPRSQGIRRQSASRQKVSWLAPPRPMTGGLKRQGRKSQHAKTSKTK